MCTLKTSTCIFSPTRVQNIINSGVFGKIEYFHSSS